MNVMVFNFKKPQQTLFFKFDRYNFVEVQLVKITI